ncbi:MAG: NAD(P)H-hydrate dehydratase [Candidatus Cloacimonetes bacterium]|nr:NAD(P)H-hydrate dehydratase [Candidatus Cloacimonadota bacterium]
MSQAVLKECEHKTIHGIGVPELLLIENAGSASAQRIFNLLEDASLLEGATVAVLAGPGANGGDGYSTARHLKQMGLPVHVFPYREPKNPDVIKHQEMARNSGCAFLELGEFFPGNYTLVVDALFGIGLNRHLDSGLVHLVETINEASLIVSLDIPTGVECDTGQALGAAVEADWTIAMQCLKPAHVLFPGCFLSGTIVVEHVGIQLEPIPQNTPILVTEESFLAPPRSPYGHKGTFGHVLCIGGSSGMGGAIRLSAKSALRIGAGKVSILAPSCLTVPISTAEPEIMLVTVPDEPKNYLGTHCIKAVNEHPASVLLLGPGAGLETETKILFQHILESATKPLVLDADALNLFSQNSEELITLCKNSAQIPVLTPHRKEFARILDKPLDMIEAQLISLGTEFASRAQCVLVLKGFSTLVAMPDGESFLFVKPNSALAKGGIGDILSGMIASMLAQGFTPQMAALQAVQVQILAGTILVEEMGEHTPTPLDFLNALPRVFHSE